MATAILGTKAAWEKAQGNQYDKTPDIEDVINAFEYLEFESGSVAVDMSLG